ncbi:LOW QUALITY PROTEIN: chondroitin sulfate proteoglycan 5 [Vipera latastei]
MGPPPAAPRLALLALLLAASEPRPSFPGDPETGGPLWRSSQASPLFRSQAATRERTAADRETPAPESNVSTGGPSPLPKESQLAPPFAAPRGSGHPSGILPAGEEAENGPVLSRRTAREMAWRDSPSEPGGDASSASPRAASPSRVEDGTWRLFDRGKGGPGSQEDVGSGDPHAKTPPNPGWATAALPPRAFDPQNRPLGHEGDLLLTPVPSTGDPHLSESPPVLEQEEVWGVPSQPFPRGSSETEAPRSVAPPGLKSTPTPKPSPDPRALEIVDVDYYDLFDGGALRGPGPDSTKAKSPVDKGVSWPFRDLYDEFSPFDESDFYPTTSFYTDGDEEEEPEEEEEEDEEEEEEGGLAGVAEEEKKEARAPTPPPAPPPTKSTAEPTARRFLLPPLQTFVVSGATGRATRGPASADPPIPENSTECRLGYARHNASCKSVCDTFPSYCHNGGQCYLVENLGAFCRYRTPSELHNDNFSLSTIAEGSHPNDDPGAPHKLPDPLKSCLKDEEAFNIQNSTSPKLDNRKTGHPDDPEANCLQNNLT